MAQDLRHIYARLGSTGKHVTADQVTKKDGPFRCLCHGVDVYHKAKSEGRRAHFASFAECTPIGESEIHKTAKALIAENLEDWTFISLCMTGWGCRTEEVKAMTFPRDEYRGVQEYRVVVGDQDRAIDVAVVKSGKLFVAIEVLHTHAIGSTKEKELKSICLYVTEISANDIITSFAEDKVLRVCFGHLCEVCSIEAKKKREAEEEIAERLLAESERRDAEALVEEEKEAARLALIPKLPFGKHKGSELESVPLEYCIWLAGFRVTGTDVTPFDVTYDEVHGRYYHKPWMSVQQRYPEWVRMANERMKTLCWHCGEKKLYEKWRPFHLECWKTLNDGQ
jgi:hypothetical protein